MRSRSACRPTTGSRTSAGQLLNTLDDVFLGIFLVELTIRILAYGRRPQDFFRDGWNVFDFVVIGAVFLPGVRENATLLRLVRLLRVMRLVTVLPDMRILVRAMVRSLPPIGSLVVLTILLMYVYGMVGWILFHEEDPQNWGNIGESMLNLFVIITLENWPVLLERGAGDPPAVVDLLRLLRADRLVPGDQHPARDHHQLDGGGARGRAPEGARQARQRHRRGRPRRPRRPSRPPRSRRSRRTSSRCGERSTTSRTSWRARDRGRRPRLRRWPARGGCAPRRGLGLVAAEVEARRCHPERCSRRRVTTRTAGAGRRCRPRARRSAARAG